MLGKYYIALKETRVRTLKCHIMDKNHWKEKNFYNFNTKYALNAQKNIEHTRLQQSEGILQQFLLGMQVSGFEDCHLLSLHIIWVQEQSTESKQKEDNTSSQGNSSDRDSGGNHPPTKHCQTSTECMA